SRPRVRRGPAQEAAGVLVGLQQDFEALAQGGVAGAGLLQEGGPLVRRQRQGLMEEALFVHGRPPGRAAASTRGSPNGRAKAPGNLVRRVPDTSSQSQELRHNQNSVRTKRSTRSRRMAPIGRRPV